MLSENVPVTSPRRDDVEWETETGPAVGVSYFIVWIVKPFSRCTGGTVVRRDVIALSSRLVIRNNERCLRVSLSFRHGIDGLLLKLGAVSGSIRWMFRKFSWADDVRDCRKGSIRSLGVEVVKSLPNHALAAELRCWESILKLSKPR